jgi:eukaryotic-like serine/threonine-protein kinase
MRVTLRVTEGPHEGRTFSFAEHDNFVVGRSHQAHFRLSAKDRFFSRFHFLVEVNPPACRLQDLNSRNGCYVNGKRVQHADLKDGDRIKAGRTMLVVSVEADPEEEEAAAGPTQTHQPAPLSVTLDAVAPPTPLPAAAPPAAGLPCPACGAPRDAGPLCASCEAAAAQLPQKIPGYRLIRRIGKGGMGLVYLALHLDDGSAVAVKTIIPAIAGNKALFKRFLREADILRQLDHPHVVRFRDHGEAGGQLYFAMEYVPGVNTQRLVKERGPLPVATAVKMMLQALSALEYAHAKGFVHRDLKPANLLVTSGAKHRTLKLADFGLARVYQASQLSGLTLSGDVGGTIAFLPPEQITSYRDAKPAADQYGASATLYYLLTGEVVYDFKATKLPALAVVLQHDPVPIRKRRPDLPEELATVIHKALAREPGDRYPDVKAFREALRPFGK